jgi:hypothetical protein
VAPWFASPVNVFRERTEVLLLAVVAAETVLPCVEDSEEELALEGSAEGLCGGKGEGGAGGREGVRQGKEGEGSRGRVRVRRGGGRRVFLRERGEGPSFASRGNAHCNPFCSRIGP